MTVDGVAEARSFLDRFEASITAKDLATLVRLCTDDIVLFGSSRANFGPEESSEYLQLVVEANTIRWLLDRSSVVHQDDDHLLVASEGQVEFDDGSGPERSDFRLTLWLVRQQGTWRIGHFHGSVPEA
jgi:ketosteroid isomerase-like protein